MSDGALKTRRIEAVKGLFDATADIPCSKDRSKLAMLDWLVKEASLFFSKFGYESEYARKLFDMSLRLAASCDPVDRSRILNSLAENTGINLQTLKAQAREIQQKGVEDRYSEFIAQIEAFARRYPRYQEVKDTEGAPFYISENESIQINQMFFVRKFYFDHNILYEASEDRFYLYDDPRGLWTPMSENGLKAMFSRDFHVFVSEHQLADKLLALKTDGLLCACLRLLKGISEKLNAFIKPPGRYVLHLSTGMLVIEPSGSIQLHAFSPDWMSRNMIPFNYNPQAQCPRFLKELLEPCLSPEDIELIQKYFGCILLGGNIIQCFLILSGTPGGGKGTLCEVIELEIGPDNVAELRTSHLSERFEISSYAGRLLLAGKDVPGDFLQYKSASVIKKLVGHDRLDGEMKGANERTRLRGQYPLIINCNSRLRVRLDGDVDAWRRRMLIVEYSRPPVGKPIPNFATQLVNEEGEGILNWGIQGGIKLLADIREYGKIQLSKEQQDRVNALLLESDSVRIFVRERVCRGAGDLTSAELVMAYVSYCNDQGWNALPQRVVENQLPDIMLNELGVQKVNDITRNGKSVRGYHGVVFKAMGGQL
ncbi:MAG: DUF5906 domain-containing protein [Victivallales bacterium]